MAGFGKIDVVTNYLMSSNKQVDTSWLPLTDFLTMNGGEYYTYYISPQVPDMDKQTAYDNTVAKKLIDEDVSKITVDYNGETYSGSSEAQAIITSTIEKIKGNAPQKTQTLFTVTNKKVALTKADMEAIMVLIEPVQEAIVNA